MLKKSPNNKYFFCTVIGLLLASKILFTINQLQTIDINSMGKFLMFHQE